MKMIVPTLEILNKVRIWRNENPENLRTPFLLSEEMQNEFYQNTINNRNSHHRYFAFMDEENHLLGFGGITNIEWENGLGEISLIVDPTKRKQGIGREAAYKLYAYAFNNLRLNTVFGEVYEFNKAVDFWTNLFPKMYFIRLPARKYVNGAYFSSIYFSISQQEYQVCRETRR